MFKKLIAVCAAAALFSLFACSSDDGGGNGNNPGSSSDSNVQPSSGSTGSLAGTEKLALAFTTNSASRFGSYPYVYTQTAVGVDENLTQFWKCNTEKQNEAPNQDECAEKDKQAASAILQNNLTNQYSPLHYSVANSQPEMKSYKVPENGQAAIGINVSDPPGKSIDESTVTQVVGMKNSATGFYYTYKGGSHAFRAAIDEKAFWFFIVESSATEATVEIPFSEFMSAGDSLAIDTPFDFKKVQQFMWVVENDLSEPKTGSLYVKTFGVLIPK